MAQAADPSCPAGSRLGTTTVGAGAGGPFYISGTVYLAGAYKGAPYSLAIVVPALAGPFDLGTVVVRAGLYVDPTTAQVTVKSDPLPQILDGIPLRLRDVRVDVDRPSFTLNPTSCDPMSVGVQIFGAQGAVANMSSPFQVGGCAALRFAPKLRIALSGKGRTRSGDHPTLTATLTQGSGQANIRTAKVTLGTPCGGARKGRKFPRGRWPRRFCIQVGNQVVQSCQFSPSIRLNSDVFAVTTVRPRWSAWPAISRS